MTRLDWSVRLRVSPLLTSLLICALTLNTLPLFSAEPIASIPRGETMATVNPSTSPRESTYIDPLLVELLRLKTSSRDRLSAERVIVSARALPKAIALVKAAGGKVISPLHLIDAVVAEVTLSQIRLLANNPEILSLFYDQKIETASQRPELSAVESAPAAPKSTSLNLKRSP